MPDNTLVLSSYGVVMRTLELYSWSNGFMKTIKIPVDEFHDWAPFHNVFAKTLGFPNFYGKNMNAWIDCMTSVDDPGCLMTSVTVDEGEFLVLDLGECTAFAELCPAQYEAILDSVAFVNFRRAEAGEAPVLAVSSWNRKPLVKEEPQPRGA
jgi:hypothetical protein